MRNAIYHLTDIDTAIIPTVLQVQADCFTCLTSPRWPFRRTDALLRSPTPSAMNSSPIMSYSVTVIPITSLGVRATKLIRRSNTSKSKPSQRANLQSLRNRPCPKSSSRKASTKKLRKPLAQISANNLSLSVPDVRTSDPESTNALWETVQNQKITGHQRETKASKGRSKETASSIASYTPSSTSSKPATKVRKIRLKDTAFRQRVLTPRGVTFPPSTELSDASHTSAPIGRQMGQLGIVLLGVVTARKFGFA